MKRGALSGYHPKAFTISPPRMDLVIKRRLHFALRITCGDVPLQILDRNISVKLESLDRILRIFVASLDENQELEECIDNVSGGNVRLGLDLVKSFLGSGHVNTEKIIRIHVSEGTYIVPLHEFLRAIIHGDGVYYAPDRSPIVNIFDISQYDRKEHFLLPVLLGFLSAPGPYSSHEGFVEPSKVYQVLQGCGFLPEQIDAAVLRAFNGKLIESVARRIPVHGQEGPVAVRVTSVGLYHVSKLCRSFSYVDAVVVDTPILCERTRRVVRDVHEIAERVERAERFREYLDESWDLITPSGNWFEWRAESSVLRREIDRIRRAVEENIGGAE